MRYGFSVLVALSCVSFVYAQTAKPKTAPVVPVELREKFFKAQAEYQTEAAKAQQATQSAQVKNVALNEQMEKLKTACGAEYVPNLDKDGEIICTEKPKAPEAAKK